MCKVLVLPGNKSIKLIEKYLKTKVKLTRGSYKNICIEINNGEVKISHNGINLKEFDFVWLSSMWRTRDIAHVVASFLDFNEIPHTNVEFASSKITDHVTLAQAEISQPQTFFARTEYSLEHIDELENLCNYPIIVKHKKGFGGKKAWLAKDKEELIEIINKLKGEGFFFQEFIPNNFDWGINIANGRVVAASKRSRKSGFLNNACQGSIETFINPDDVPEIVKDCALKSAKALDLNWTRADIIFNENTKFPVLLEMNRCPGMTVESPEVKAFAGFLQNEIGVLNLI